MKKVYQTIVDPGHGNCMQAAIAALFDDELENVPNFVELNSWYDAMQDYLKTKGYRYKGVLHNKKWVNLNQPSTGVFKECKWHKPSMLNKTNLKKRGGVNGLFYASVCSPRFFTWETLGTHAVIIDKDFNIVHDPNKAYESVLSYPLSSVIDYNGIINVYIFDKI